MRWDEIKQQLAEIVVGLQHIGDAISVLPDGQLRLELAGNGGAEEPEVPP